MSRRFGIDVSHFQDPAAPAGVTWSHLSEKSSFVMVRATYGAWPDPAAVAHVRAARVEAFQIGLYHFFCVKQAIHDQLDHLCAQANACGIGRGDILPALDVEDDGPNKVDPSWEPLLKEAADVLISEFGGVIIYITQAAWIALGRPQWMLEAPVFLWVAHYTNAPKPATPGNVVPAIWQNRVGLYNPGAPFVEKEALLPRAIDQDVADGPLPLATLTPAIRTDLPPIGPEPPSQSDLWSYRLGALLDAHLDLQGDRDEHPFTE